MYYKIIITLGLTNTSITAHNCHFLFVVRTLKIHSLGNNTVLLTVITMLCIPSPKLTHLGTKVTVLMLDCLLFLFFYFLFVLHFFDSFFFSFSLASFPLVLCKDAWSLRCRVGTMMDAREKSVDRKENMDNLGKSMVLFYYVQDFFVQGQAIPHSRNKRHYLKWCLQAKSLPKCL